MTKDAMIEATAAGVRHRKAHPITIMIVGGNMQAVALGKVLFEANIMRSDGHQIFAAFLQAWCDAGVEDACAC